jgi:hypothetical protein
MSNQTFTIQNAVDYARQNTKLLPLTGVGGVSNQPAVQFANDTLEELLAAPFPWKFNRNTLKYFVTTPNKQDYIVNGACAFVVAGAGSNSADAGGVALNLATDSTPGLVTSAGTCTATCKEAITNIINVGDTVYIVGATVSAYNSTYTDAQGNSNSGSGWSGGYTVLTTPTSTSFTFSMGGSPANSGAPGISDFGWLEYATATQSSSNATKPYVWHWQAVRDIQPDSKVGIPSKISVVSDDGAGNLTVRLRDLPGSQPFQVTMVYQKKPPVIAASATLSSTYWTPFPDRLNFVVNQMFLAKALSYSDSPKADAAFQKAMLMAAKASGADDNEETEQYIVPEDSLSSGLWVGGGQYW